MVKGKRNLALAMLAAVIAAGLYLWGFSHTPVGQRPLVSLTADDVSPFRSQFDAAADRVRVVLLVSPT